MEETETHQILVLEYTQINDNFRFLADVRFKLLALVPTLGGAAIFLLTRAGLETGKAPASSRAELFVVLLVSVLGFLATLGITLYDQRNSELYNALIHRAKWLEKQFRVLRIPTPTKALSKGGGQFSERPSKQRRLIFKAGHDLALALIYGPLLGAWLFPILYSILRLVGIGNEWAQMASAAVTALAVVGFTGYIVWLDKR